MLLLFSRRPSGAGVGDPTLVHALEIARHGRYRNILISEQNVVGAWSLGERIQPRAKSIVFDFLPHLHGTWMGTGTVRGVPSQTIPEGEAGATFTGTGWVEVLHDPGGYRLEGDSGARTLSLADGDADVVVKIRTTQNDGVLRAIVQKQETNSSGNGYHLALQNGQLRAYLKVGGVVIFNFARDYPITDDLEHEVQLHYSANLGFARIIIDGVPIGADVAASTEPAVNTGNLRFGMFNDDTGGFIGTLWLPMLGREGNPDLCAALNQTRTWEAITDDVRVESAPVVARHGTIDSSPVALTAPPAQLTFVLDNSNLNDLGLQGAYTPGHANALAGFLEGAPVRWRVTDSDDVTHTLFRGFIERITPEAGLARSQRVHVLAESWCSYAMRAPVGRIPVQANLRSDDAVRWLLDQAERPPVDVDLAAGDAIFPLVFHDLDPDTSIYQALARVVFNEGGRLYERRDGTLTFESAFTRFLKLDPDATWTEYEIEALDAERERDQIVNLIRTTITPTRVGVSATDELASMSQRIEIPPLATVTVELNIRDPAQPDAQAGGIDLVTPVATTDYTMNAAANGSGADLTAFASVSLPSEEQGGESVLPRVTNTHHAFPGWFTTRIRGRKLTRFDDQTWTDRDDASIRAHDPRPLPGGLKFDYLANEESARAIARRLIALRKDPFTAPRAVIRRGIDAAVQGDILARELGDVVRLQESMIAMAGTERTFVDGLECRAGGERPLVATYTLNRGPATQPMWVVEVEGYGELDETAVLA